MLRRSAKIFQKAAHVPYPGWRLNKVFRHVETLFIQGNQIRTDENKPPFLVIKRWFVLISTNLITLDE